MRRAGIPSVKELDLALIARSQVGRPDVIAASPTYFELLKPLLNCDTKSHADLIKILEHIRANLDA